ncbi:hypothetical protein [Aerosakkonema funiforme]|uniref:hypothetical protein n=1 Tax=Aerosakkonema funiforme TaxID=1246630 RepID=UPI0035BADC88
MDSQPTGNERSFLISHPSLAQITEERSNFTFTSHLTVFLQNFFKNRTKLDLTFDF